MCVANTHEGSLESEVTQIIPTADDLRTHQGGQNQGQKQHELATGTELTSDIFPLTLISLNVNETWNFFFLLLLVATS